MFNSKSPDTSNNIILKHLAFGSPPAEGRWKASSSRTPRLRRTSRTPEMLDEIPEGKAQRHLIYLVKGGLMNFHIRSPLVETTQLYRYMTFNQFVSLVEQRKFYLTRIQNWEDTWELPSFSIPTKIETGEITYDSKMGEKYLYGSCWTRLGESDAMWRIYAPQRDGIMIKTTVKKFETLEQLSNGYISTVYYYNDLLDGLGKTLSDRDFRRPYSLGLIKRSIFS